MPIQQINPTQAKKILDENAEALYLDVRSVREFDQGHAEGAINIPLLDHNEEGQMVPNPDFVQVVEAYLPKEKVLVIGCQAGGRSQKACEILEAKGYQQLSNMMGGFGGSPQTPGWKQSGLPVTQESAQGSSYESIQEKVK